jgi:hypothetical protein
MIRRRKLITHPSQAPSGTRHIKVKALQKLPEIIDLAKRDKRSQDYLERAKKRRI